jgi:transposase InsO family protein
VIGSIIQGMVIDMNETRLCSLEQLQAFLEATAEVRFLPFEGEDSRYAHIEAVLRRFGYRRLGRKHKGLALRYLVRTTGYSRQQVTRLVRQFLDTGGMVKRYRAPAHGFARKYTAADVALLAETDALHDGLSGPATRHLMQRALAVFGDTRYARLARISVAHLYNLRAATGYRARRQHWTKTRPTTLAIGSRRAPQPDGHPGFLRIDSVHQGEQDGVKGVYHINVVDCVTQWEVVATCEKLSEAYLLPVIQALLDAFPFTVLGFHADNGSEYINHRVADMLEKLRVEFTKSRPRHSNDNGLAETKNGAVVRKCFGYSHIPQRFATQVNAFCAEHLNPYLNFHRPCLFAEDVVNAKGKVTKRYPQRLVMTPLEKLATLPEAPSFLKPGLTLEQIQTEAKRLTDNEAARQLNEARRRLFLSIQRRSKRAA